MAWLSIHGWGVGVQVLAKSCKPIPVMLMGAIMGKK